MTDPTETVRRFLIDNDVPTKRLVDVKESYDTQQLQELFTVHGFLAPFVSVTRKSDGAKGAMLFTHSPRRYFDFTPEK